MHYLWKSVERLKSWLNQGDMFSSKFRGCCPQNFWFCHVIPLVKLSLSGLCWWESVERVKSHSPGCFGLKSPLGRFSTNQTLRTHCGDFVENFEFLSLIGVDWANLSINRVNGWKVIHGFVYCGNPYSRPKLDTLWKMNPSDVFASIETPNGTFVARDLVVWRMDRQNRLSRVCLLRWQETKKN